MTSVLRHLDFDCADPYALAGFWEQVLGYRRDAADGPDDDEVILLAPEGAGPHVLFLRVPEGKPDEPRTDSVNLLMCIKAAPGICHER